MTDTTTPKRPRGFAALTPERQREIASLGGKAAHQSGHAHQYTTETARAAGIKRHQKTQERAGTQPPAP